MHVRNCVFPNIDVPIGEHYSTLQQGQHHCSIKLRHLAAIILQNSRFFSCSSFLKDDHLKDVAKTRLVG